MDLATKLRKKGMSPVSLPKLHLTSCSLLPVSASTSSYPASSVSVACGDDSVRAACVDEVASGRTVVWAEVGAEVGMPSTRLEPT